MVFGRGLAAVNLSREVARLEAQRIMLIDASYESDLSRQLTEPGRDCVVEVFDGVRPHVPHQVAIAAQDLAALSKADLLISIGGGSTTGTAKIIARKTGTPIPSVPTTHADSEMTPEWGMTANGLKGTGKAPASSHEWSSTTPHSSSPSPGNSRSRQP